jgi:hypothetical protein
MPLDPGGTRRSRIPAGFPASASASRRCARRGRTRNACASRSRLRARDCARPSRSPLANLAACAARIPMKPRQVHPRWRHQCCQSCQQIQRLHHNVRDAIAIGRLELVPHLTRRSHGQSPGGHRRAAHIAAQALELGALAELNVNAGVQRQSPARGRTVHVAFRSLQPGLFEALCAGARSKFLLAEVAVAVGVDAVEALADTAFHRSFAAADLAIAVAVQLFEYDFHVCSAADRQVLGCCSPRRHCGEQRRRACLDEDGPHDDALLGRTRRRKARFRYFFC